MNINNSLIAGLTRAANHFVMRMKDKVAQNGLPQAISDATSLGTANVSGETVSIEVTIDLKEAPMAAAFEWGSGLHRTKGGAGLYPIAAKDAPNLVFWWERGNKWFVGAKLPYGHPGVAPRPYIKPTIVAEMPEIKRIVGQEVKASILIGIKEMFST